MMIVFFLVMLDYDFVIVGVGFVGFVFVGWFVCCSVMQYVLIVLIDVCEFVVSVNDLCVIVVLYGSCVLFDMFVWFVDVMLIEYIYVLQCGYFGCMLIDCDEYVFVVFGYVVCYGLIVQVFVGVVCGMCVDWFMLIIVYMLQQDVDGVMLMFDGL